MTCPLVLKRSPCMHTPWHRPTIASRLSTTQNNPFLGARRTDPFAPFLPSLQRDTRAQACLRGKGVEATSSRFRVLQASPSPHLPSLAHHCAETRTMPLLLPLFRSIFALTSRAATTPRASLATLGTLRHAQHQLHTSTFTPRLTPRLPSSSSAAFSTSSRLPARPEHDSLFPGIPFRVEVNKGAKWEHESTIPAGVREVSCSRRAAGFAAGGRES